MKNVLFVCSNFPWPPTDGEKVRTFNLIKNLAEIANLTVAYPKQAFPSDILLETLPSNIKWIEYNRSENGIFLKLRAFLTFTPLFYLLADSKDLKAFFNNMQIGEYDAIHLDGLPAYNFFGLSKRVTNNIVLDLRDSWTLLYKRLFLTSGKSLISYIKLKAVEKIESKIVKKVKKVVLISEVDKLQLINKYGVDSKKLFTVANGVSFDFLKVPARFIDPEKLVLAFTGAMNYQPNCQAVSYFAREIFPAIREEFPAAKFIVIGKNPTAEISSLESDAIRITGEVDSVATELGDVDIIIAPLLSGAGMKNKVLEALAAGRPLVASKIAVEGIRIENGVHYILADTESDWVEAVKRLVKDDKFSLMIAANGREEIYKNYSWIISSRQFLDIYEG